MGVVAPGEKKSSSSSSNYNNENKLRNRNTICWLKYSARGNVIEQVICTITSATGSLSTSLQYVLWWHPW